MTNTIKFPIWFTILTSLLVISNLLIFGILSLLYPAIPFPDMGHTEAAFPIQFFAVRHIAFAFPLLYGLIKRDVKILTVCYSIFMVIAILDVSLLIVKGYYIPIIGKLSYPATIALSVMAFILPMSLGLKHLSRYTQVVNFSSSP